MTGPRLGLVVNPVAGLGGRVALKGSDGAGVQARALALGAVPVAGERAGAALAELAARCPGLTVWTAGGAMGADAVRAAGLRARVVYVPGAGNTAPGGAVASAGEHGERATPGALYREGTAAGANAGSAAAGGPAPGGTTAEDTARAVAALLRHDVGLLLFAGGDGTARDVLDALPGPDALPVLGIPAGVKMHSAVFAVHPRAAGRTAAAWTSGRVRMRAAEVMDRDEEALRAGRFTTRLYGWLTAPDEPRHVQQRKTGSALPPPDAVHGIAAEVAAKVGAGGLLVLGPGSTTHAVAAALGASGGSPAGVDVLRLTADGAHTVLRDARADQLLTLPQPWIALSPIGGQGFLLGRGNQQIAPDLLRSLPRERLLVLSTEAKLAALGGRPLLVDTGDARLDDTLSGHVRVITGRRGSAMYRLSA